MTEHYPPAEWLGLAEIAERLGVKRGTADVWRHRGLLPEPEATIGGRPAWRWSTVETWARTTGRLEVDRPFWIPGETE